MNYIVNAKIGERLVTCRILPVCPTSMISGALLEKYEMDSKTIPSIRGERIFIKFNIPITFQSGEESITIVSQLQVGDDFCIVPMKENLIVLGMDWLMGRSLIDKGLHIYTTKIVHRFISRDIIPYLNIQSIEVPNHIICVEKNHDILLTIYKSDDNDSDCSSDSS